MTNQSGEPGQTTQITNSSEPGPDTSKPEKPRDLRIMVAIPSGGDWKRGFGWSLVTAVCYFSSMPYDGNKSIAVEVVGGPLLPENRRRLLARAYELDATHILWLEDRKSVV